MKRQKPVQPVLGIVAPSEGRSKWRGPREVAAVRMRRLRGEQLAHEAVKRYEGGRPPGVVWPTLKRMPK